jgi:hypothetical protein
MTGAQGDLPQAQLLLEESLALARGLGDRHGIAEALRQLGQAAAARGDSAAAGRCYRESLALYREIGAARMAPFGLEGLAGVACAQSQPERAARLLGAATGLREAIGAPRPPTAQAYYEHTLAAVRASLNGETLEAAHAAGRAMTLEQAVAYALEAAPDTAG